MKKNYLLGICLMLSMFSACKKENSKPDSTTPTKDAKTVKQKNLSTQPPTYNDLILQPRQPGENFDTYLGNWGGISIRMMGSPVWNHDLYPNLVNGVPAYNATYAVDNQSYVTQATSGNEDIFTLSVATLGSTNFQAFQTDVSNFNNAYSTYINYTSNGVKANKPKAEDYIKSSYSTSGARYVAVTGKLIRVTTGSHWAIATVNYPIPDAVIAQPPPTSYVIGFIVTQGGSRYEYDLNINNGVVTAMNSFNISTGANNPITSYNSSNATFTRISGSTHYHISNLSITPQNFASFIFNGDSTDLN